MARIIFGMSLLEPNQNGAQIDMVKMWNVVDRDIRCHEAESRQLILDGTKRGPQLNKPTVATRSETNQCISGDNDSPSASLRR